MYVNHIYTYVLKILRDIHILYIHMFLEICLMQIFYIYIYTVGGVGSPIGRQSGSLNLRKKTLFYCGKIEIFDVVHFILDVFQLRNKKKSVEVEVVDGP